MSLVLLSAVLLNANAVYVGEFSGPITPASSAYFLGAITQAENDSASCLIIKMDTPGGLDESMREITKRILNAAVPVVVYVAPKGARAASAGVFILYASHVAAMAPGTNVGAAHPVGLGGEKQDSVMIGKVTNDAVAYLQSLAKERHRNIAWAEQAVRQSVSVDADRALKLGICEIIARNEQDLIAQLEGRQVVVNEDTLTLAVVSAPVKKFAMSFRDRLLMIITNPNIAYILLLLGIYGMFFELQHPGLIFPGVVGGICLILAFYALHILPVNYAGVALIVLSAIFFIIEIYLTSHGLATIGGVIALVFGSVILFNSDVPFLRVSWEVIMFVAIIIVAFVVLMLIMGIGAQFRKPASGKEGMVGESGIAKTEIDSESGTVFVHGEFWNAVSDKPIKKNSRVKVVSASGVLLKVDPCNGVAPALRRV